MSFFFLFNDEKRIGFKKLSDADLGFSESSNQSHIGLYEGLLTFLDNSDVVKSAMLIFQDYCDILDCSFDRIENPDGSFRSPKIRVGNDVTNSVVSKIREFAHRKPNTNWYLVWFGLESKELVFWLLEEGTKDYSIARSFFTKDNVVLNENSPTYIEANEYLLRRINFVSIGIQRDMEVRSLLGDPKHIYKKKDIEKAAQLFKKTGRAGEELVAQYFDKEKAAKRISSFIGENRSSESGLPYDFIVDDKIYIDVKTTRFDFNQYLYYSNYEIDFAASMDEKTYSVYRIYDVLEATKKLQICSNCLDYMLSVQKPIKQFQAEIESKRSLFQPLNIGVAPNICFKDITAPIIL